MQTLKRVENTPLKKLFEVVWLFRTFSEVYILKNNHEYTFKKKFFEVVWLVLKIFLGVDLEKCHEYTFEKNSLKSFDCFEHFTGRILQKIIMNTHSKKLFEAFQLVSKIFLSADSEKSHEYIFEKIL